MKFDKHLPTERLKPYIKYFVVSENELENEYKIFPSSGLVIGFQYKGQLSIVKDNTESKLTTAGITGITDSFKSFKNTADIGTILVYFTEIGFTHFASTPANELFNLSLSLDDIFYKSSVTKVEERLAVASTDKQRVQIVEQFLGSQLKDIQADKLSQKLLISQSPFEKRFRKVVGTTAKKFASIVRFNAVLDNLTQTKTLTEICYENNFFDQAHFIKDFKQYTGDTPENFKRFL